MIMYVNNYIKLKYIAICLMSSEKYAIKMGIRYTIRKPKRFTPSVPPTKMR